MPAPEMIEFSQCSSCSTIDARSIGVCTKCLGTDMRSVLIAGEGTLVSWTTIRKPPLRFKAEGTYHVGVFDLDRGLRVTGRFLPCQEDRVGDRVIAVHVASTENSTPTFRVEKNA